MQRKIGKKLSLYINIYCQYTSEDYIYTNKSKYNDVSRKSIYINLHFERLHQHPMSPCSEKNTKNHSKNMNGLAFWGDIAVLAHDFQWIPYITKRNQPYPPGLWHSLTCAAGDCTRWGSHARHEAACNGTSQEEQREEDLNKMKALKQS